MEKYVELKNELNEILKKLKENSMIHNNHNDSLYKVEEIVLLSNGRIGALLADYALYSINRIYLSRNGEPRISAYSVGPNINGKKDLDDGVYNWLSDDKKSNLFRPILAKYNIDGTIIKYAPNDIIEEAFILQERENEKYKL